MNTTPLSRRAFLKGAAAGALALSQFGTDHFAWASTARALDLPPVKPASIGSDFAIAGSSVVRPISNQVAAKFVTDGFKGAIKVDGGGTLSGYDQLIAGKVDIADASIPMTAEYLDQLKAKKLTPVEFQIAFGALTFVTNRQNRFLDNLSTEQIGLIFSGKAKSWKEINPKWPDEKIRVFRSGDKSGTIQFVADKSLAQEKSAPARANLIRKAAAEKVSEDYAELAKGVAVGNFNVGYVGYAFYSANRSKLRAISVDTVMPNDKTVAGNQYPFMRPLFITTTKEALKAKPQIAEFINYYITNVNAIISSSGYFPAPPGMLEASKKTWLATVK
jgi:phosphate transport system substrate-binding protein